MDRRRSEFAKAFKAADTDGNGSLNLDEYLELYRSQGVNLSREDAEAFFEEKDRDHDGKISFKEFSGQVTEVEKAWNALDAHKSGKVSKEDVEAGIKKYRKTLPPVITTDQGKPFLARLESKLKTKGQEPKLTYEEFCALMHEAKLTDDNKDKSASNESTTKRPDTGVVKSQQPKTSVYQRSNSNMDGKRGGGGEGGSRKTSSVAGNVGGRKSSSSQQQRPRDQNVSSAAASTRFSRHMSVD